MLKTSPDAGPAITYDITRLVTRMFNTTPNGIDRIDFAFADHFLKADAPRRHGCVWTPLGPRLMPGRAAHAAVEGIGLHWGEGQDADEDPAYAHAVAWLRTGATAAPSIGRRIAEGRSGRTSGVWRWLRAHGLPIAQKPEKHLPPHARYVNVSQFPLWVSSYFDWLERRRDVKAVFFIHDLLPLQMPEYFRAAESERHRRRLANLARFGAGAIVASRAVEAALATHLRGLGRSLPILVAPFPVADVFAQPPAAAPARVADAYFVMCGTIEPRKNHLMLLHVWRELVARMGQSAPRLVLVGTRGWKFGPVADLLADAPGLRSHVLEISGLTTPGLKHLMDNARAVLLPTFAEGYGLPVHEALAVGVPVVASDIPVFREIEAANLSLISPIDGEGWLAKVWALADAARAEPHPRAAPRKNAYFDSVEDFISTL